MEQGGQTERRWIILVAFWISGKGDSSHRTHPGEDDIETHLVRSACERGAHSKTSRIHGGDALRGKIAHRRNAGRTADQITVEGSAVKDRALPRGIEYLHDFA